MAFSDLKKLCDSLTRDSDEIQEMFCEHCEKHDSTYIPAEGFCVECVEYLCTTCLKYHKRYTNDHTMKDKDSMPQHFYLEKCLVHANQLVKFYCDNCKKVACCECKENAHKKCKNVSHLPTIADSTDLNGEVKNLYENMDQLSEELEKHKNNLNLKIETADALETAALTIANQCAEKLLATFKKHQKEIIDNFDQKMEETITRLKKERKALAEQMAVKQGHFEKKLANDAYCVRIKILHTNSADQKELRSIRQKNIELKYNLQSLSLDLTQKQNTDQKCQLFVTTKMTNEKIKKLKQNVAKLKAENMDIHYYRVKCKDVNPDINSHDAKETLLRYEKLPSSTKERYAYHLFDLPSKVVQWSDLCLLDENTYLAADCNGNALVIYRNTTTNTNSYGIINTNSGPWAITKVEDNKIAVTFPETGTVMFVTFSESMTVINTHEINVEAKCRGIAYGNNNLIVSYDTVPGKLQITDMSGRVLKTLVNNSNGEPLFDAPYFLALSQDNTTIYVSDYNKHTVTSLSFDGKVKAIYADDDLTGPCHLTADSSGTVYVCGLLSNNVHQISSDLTKVKILLDNSYGIDSPISVRYNEENNRLYVGMWDSSIIKVFDLSTK